MTPELGQGVLLVALGLTLWGVAAAAAGGSTGRPALVESAQHAVVGVFALLTLAFALLVYAFLTFDFSVRYVALNTNLGTPFYYRITGVWGALEGSLVLWAWMLGLYSLIVVLGQRERARELYPWVLAVMLVVLTFFLLVMTVAAPPFTRLTPAPANGRGLNPLLEDTGMITHPIALYLGFTGFTVPFAFAIAALVTSRVGDTWITLTRRWTIIAGTSSPSACSSGGGGATTCWAGAATGPGTPWRTPPSCPGSPPPPCCTR
jgi:cytochrome c-type biogenesis protein CcmF